MTALYDVAWHLIAHWETGVRDGCIVLRCDNGRLFVETVKP